MLKTPFLLRETGVFYKTTSATEIGGLRSRHLPMRYNPAMRRLFLALAAIILFSPFPSLAQKDTPGEESAPDVPDAIALPTGLEPVLFVRAKGSQIYACQAGTDGNLPGY